MSFIAPIHTSGTDSSLQQQLYMPHFLTAPIDSAKFPETCVAPRAAQRGIEVSTALDALAHPKVCTARQLQQACPQHSMRTTRAAACVHVSLQGLRNLDATPRLNLASFVTT